MTSAAPFFHKKEDSIKMKDTLSENCKISDHDCKWTMAKPKFLPNTAAAFDLKNQQSKEIYSILELEVLQIYLFFGNCLV